MYDSSITSQIPCLIHGMVVIFIFDCVTLQNIIIVIIVIIIIIIIITIIIIIIIITDKFIIMILIIKIS